MLSLWQLKSILVIKHCKNGMIKKAVARDPKTLEKYRTMLAEQIQYFKVTQYFFFKQWGELKDYANQKGIKIIGDMPIYVLQIAWKFWTKPELFQLDKERNPFFCRRGSCRSIQCNGATLGQSSLRLERA